MREPSRTHVCSLLKLQKPEGSIFSYSVNFCLFLSWASVFNRRVGAIGTFLYVTAEKHLHRRSAFMSTNACELFIPLLGEMSSLEATYVCQRPQGRVFPL